MKFLDLNEPATDNANLPAKAAVNAEDGNDVANEAENVTAAGVTPDEVLYPLSIFMQPILDEIVLWTDALSAFLPPNAQPGFEDYLHRPNDDLSSAFNKPSEEPSQAFLAIIALPPPFVGCGAMPSPPSDYDPFQATDFDGPFPGHFLSSSPEHDFITSLDKDGDDALNLSELESILPSGMSIRLSDIDSSNHDISTFNLSYVAKDGLFTGTYDAEYELLPEERASFEKLLGGKTESTLTSKDVLSFIDANSDSVIGQQELNILLQTTEYSDAWLASAVWFLMEAADMRPEYYQQTASTSECQALQLDNLSAGDEAAAGQIGLAAPEQADDVTIFSTEMCPDQELPVEPTLDLGFMEFVADQVVEFAFQDMLDDTSSLEISDV